MAGRPRLLPLLLREQLKLSLKRKVVSLISSEASTGVAGHVFNSLSSLIHSQPQARRFLTSTHLAPSCCEPGRVSHSLGISEIGLRIGDFSIRNPQFENSYKDPANFRRSSERPRASRDFTVPTLTRNVAATSS